jgi:Glycosyl transferase family 11
MEIIVRPFSGLGNQLFQYAAGRFYARQYGANLTLINDSEETPMSHGSYPRPFLLRKFSIVSPIREIAQADRILFSEVRGLHRAALLLRTVLRAQLIKEPWEERYTFHAELPIRTNVASVYLVGYWQVHKIADAMASELRRELTVVEPPTGINETISNRIVATRTPVSLHVRRGDYTLPAEREVALPISYYENCIRHMRARLTDPTFFVFSDDIPYCKGHLPKDAELVFVDHNDSSLVHEDLRLMSQCSHHIIANSTLSWWGAWLNPRSDKIVLAPKHWRVGGCTETPDLIPLEWTRVLDAKETLDE